MAKSRGNRVSPLRPYEVLFQMVIGKWISQALGTIVEIGVPDQLAKGARRYSREADFAFADVNPEDYVALVIPGGRAPEYIRNDSACQNIVRHFFQQHKPLPNYATPAFVGFRQAQRSCSCFGKHRSSESRKRTAHVSG